MDKKNIKCAIEWFKTFEDDANSSSDESDDNNLNLPYVERFRADKLDDIIPTKDNISEFKNFVKTKQFPHMILYGPPGTGKTSTIMACGKELYKRNINTMMLVINASEERGIQIIRDKVKNFSSTKGIFMDKDSPVFKIVVLDEADSMTVDAQAMLRSVIEKHTKNVRFVLICNYISKINPAIKSRCTLFRYAPLGLKNIKNRILKINKELKLKITSDGINMLYKISNGDMRKLLNNMQATSSIYNEINEETVCKFVNYPTTSNINKIFKILTENNFKNSFEQIKYIINKYNYNITNIIRELAELIKEKFLNGTLKDELYEKYILHINNVEINMALSCNSDIQLQYIVGIFSI
jgi:replication factor C subunit 3/5